MNDPKSQHNQQNTDNNPQRDPATGLTVERPPDETKIGKRHTDTTNTKNKPSQHSRTDRIMASASVIIALATIAYAGIAFYQLKVMSTTLSEMKNSGDKTVSQTDRIITEANRLAASSEKTAQQGKRALDATIQQSRLEQRAWVGVVHTISPGYKEGEQNVYVKDGQPIKMGVTIVNSGKTPARNVHTNVSVFYLKSTDEFVPTFNELTTIGAEPSTTVIQPSAFSSINAGPIPEVGSINKTDIANITNGRYILYIAGKITYEDVFKRPHSTLFCLFLDPSLTVFNTCKNHNEAN